MSKVQITGNVSGTGTVTIESPNTNTDSTITLPSTGGTMITTTTTGLNANNITVGVLAVANGGTGSNTATFSGANITSLNASNISSGTLAVDRGGTGASTLTANNVIIGNGTSTVTFVAPGTTGNVLTSNGTVWASTAPAAPSAPSTAQVLTATAGATAGDAGTYVFGRTTSGDRDFGTTLAGSSIQAAAMAVYGFGSYTATSLTNGTAGLQRGSNLSGTWRCMGVTGDPDVGGAAGGSATLWLRIS